MGESAHLCALRNLTGRAERVILQIRGAKREQSLIGVAFQPEFRDGETWKPMIRRRQAGSGNWARGAFAAFWILLGCASGFYLFNVVTDPTLGGQLVKLSPSLPGESSQPQDLAAIQESLRDLSQQVAALSGRLEGSAPSEAPAPPEPPAAAETPAPAPTPAESTGEPAPPPQAEPAEAPPQPDAKPVEQAALDATQSPAAAPEPPAPPKPYEPPPVAVAPLDDLPAELEARTNDQPEAAAEPEAAAQAEPPAMAEPGLEAAPPAPGAPAPQSAAAMAEPPAPSEPAASPTSPEPAAPPPETETAALDPIALPPAANDGSTRYGIEIGSVAKQDGLRPLWREYLTNHAALVAGLQPRRVLAPDKKWRLIAGPFTSAEEAAQACALFKKASRPCEATVYAGDSL